MPIKPENKARYPHDWKQIRERILERAAHRCEWCGVPNYSTRSGKRIVLTIAHLDHQPEHCSPVNLRALCQRCHLAHDLHLHMANAARTRAARKDAARPLLEAPHA